MAYGLRYQSIWSNESQEDVTISILQKDFVGDPEVFITTDCELNDTSNDNVIIARDCKLSLWANDATTITWETFLTGAYDEWYITVESISHKFFEGYLTPEEGSSPFLDKPYDIILRATNGLKLLKDVPLTTLAGIDFHGKFTALEYLIAALSKTGVDISVRIYGSIYNADMTDRGTDIDATFWNQIKYDHRTFQKDATTFISCYDTILKMLDRFFRIYYFDGQWIVFLTWEHQYAPGGLFYTDFTSNGTLIGGAEDTEGYASIGKAEAIYPINEDQLISSSFPIKFAKTNYDYNVWPEIPLNNKFSRGTLIGSGTDGDGNPYEDYDIDDWFKNMVDITATPPNFTFDPVEGDIFLRRTFNIYGIELKREVFFETPTTVSAGGGYVKWLLAESLPVNKGDQIKFGASLRFDNDFSGAGDSFSIIGRIYLIPDVGTDYYSLDNNVAGQETGFGKWVKESGTPPNFISVDIPEDSDSTKLKNQTITSDTIPENGTLYIALQHSNDGTNAGGNKWFSAFEFEYIPYIAGGYIPVKGDFWQHTQTANQLDKDEASIEISDTIIRVLQGCMFNADGITATTPTWYPYGELTPTESHYKELVNIARFNVGYRRFLRLEGSFTGLFYSPINDQTNLQPVSFHKNYLLADLSGGHQMILVPPLTMNLGTGNIKANFEEVYKDSADGTQQGDTQQYGLIFGR